MERYLNDNPSVQERLMARSNNDELSIVSQEATDQGVSSQQEIEGSKIGEPSTGQNRKVFTGQNGIQ